MRADYYFSREATRDFRSLLDLMYRSRGSASDMALLAANSRDTSPAVVDVIRSTVNPTTLDSATSAAFGVQAAAFVESLGEADATNLVKALGVTLPSHNGPLLIVSAIASGVVAETLPKPVRSFDLDLGTIARAKPCAVVVISAELERQAGIGALVERELAKAVTRASNDALVVLLSAGAASIASSGDTPAAIAADLENACAAVGATAGSRLVLLTSPASLLHIAFATGSAGLAFLDTSAVGGSIGGIQIIAVDGLTGSPNDSLLIDASRVGIADSAFNLSIGRHANLEMSDTPSGASAPISLWQSNLAAFRAERLISVGLTSDSSATPVACTIVGGW